MGMKEARAENVSPKALDKVLVRHPKLRLDVMHAGYPMLEEMVLLMYMPPHVYVDLGAITGRGLERSSTVSSASGRGGIRRLNHVRIGSDGLAGNDRTGRGCGDRAPFLTAFRSERSSTKMCADHARAVRDRDRACQFRDP